MYKNALGQPEEKATISVFDGDYGKPGIGYLALCTTSDAPTKKWDYTSRDVSYIVAEMTADGWDCVVESDGYNAPRIVCTHRETKAAVDKINDDNNIIFKNCERGYIRFGNIPTGGRSKNYRDGVLEEGVSVFVADFAKNGKYRIIGNRVEIASYHAVCDRKIYRVWGKKVGTGADGEPALKITSKQSIT